MYALGNSGAARMAVPAPSVDSGRALFCYALTDTVWVTGGAVAVAVVVVFAVVLALAVAVAVVLVVAVAVAVTVAMILTGATTRAANGACCRAGMTTAATCVLVAALLRNTSLAVCWTGA